MSFALTETQYVDGTKDITRRLGWLTLKPGDKFMGVDKAMGLKKGEKSRVLGASIVLDVRREPLFYITDKEVEREGFPGKTAAWFVEMFCKANKCTPMVEITRIEFKRLKDGEA